MFNNNYELRVTSSKLQAKPARAPLLTCTRHLPLATYPAGFTLIELLIVLGIILVLIGLLFGGAKTVAAQAKERDTKTMLETCKTMFENYKTATHLAPRGTDNFTPSQWYTTQLPAMGQATPQALGLPGQQINYASSPGLLLDTAATFSFLESLPENQTIIANLPGSKKITVSVSLTGNTTQAILPLDGWGNPIFFVPGGGLGINASNKMVWLDGANQGIVTSAGSITAASTPYNLSTYAPVTPGAGQPFFVSAGPDGDISNAHGDTSGTPTSDKTDDNIYSFNN
jgi:prepilin-type N-terminal cleavage/methylation domain-containing protein